MIANSLKVIAPLALAAFVTSGVAHARDFVSAPSGTIVLAAAEKAKETAETQKKPMKTEKAAKPSTPGTSANPAPGSKSDAKAEKPATRKSSPEKKKAGKKNKNKQNENG